MTDNYAALGDIVTQSRQLLDLIKGGALAKFDQDAKAFLANMQDTAPNIALTRNQVLGASVGRTLPDCLGVNQKVTLSLVASINGNPTARDAQAKSLLADIQTGVQRDYADFRIRESNWYWKTFNIYRVSWDFLADDIKYLVFPSMNELLSPVPGGRPMTSAAFVKLEQGELIQSNDAHFAQGAVLGEWRFTKTDYNVNAFGYYIHAHPYAQSLQGSMLIALPVVATGYLNHPNKLFALAEM
ncbi:hypothetical protein BA953_16605 [Vibrio coralliilyticus]|uniref:hypothetical protein n=1 Tax=Vibrio coralliilyticus TaxID=190893 RepID=UPI000810BFEA|nr:hypothetical protein [Vibrio coralliilyticus]ANW25817.1 hypothetical protein BA953_16605 [Vibrio coralliilyticus]